MKYSNEYMYGGKKKKKKTNSYKKGGKLSKAEDRIKQLEAEIDFMKKGGIMPSNDYAYGAGMGIAADVMGGIGSVVGNIPGIGTAVGAGLSSLGEGMEYYAEKAAASEDGKVSFKDTDFADLGTKMAIGAAKGATGTIGSMAIGAAEQGLDALTTTEAEKQEEEYASILNDPSHPLYEETLLRQQEKNKALRGTGAIGAGIGLASNIIGGKVSDAYESTGEIVDATTGVMENLPSEEILAGMNPQNYKYGSSMYNNYAYGNKMYNDYAKGGKADFEPHMMYDPKTGKAYKANIPADHERMKELGYLHKNEMAYGSNMFNEYKAGGKQMIKRADGSYSQRGLWDNIRANTGSGKKPTKEMKKQERKIKANEKAYGGNIHQVNPNMPVATSWDKYTQGIEHQGNLAARLPGQEGPLTEAQKKAQLTMSQMQAARQRNYPVEAKNLIAEKNALDIATYGEYGKVAATRNLSPTHKGSLMGEEGRDTMRQIDKVGLNNYEKMQSEIDANTTYTSAPYTGESIYNDYGVNKFVNGGDMYNNNGFGNNNMNQIPVNEFNAGGTHEANPLGGIPQGIGANGAPNLVEEGELKIPDPRDPSGNASFIVSAQPDMKITKELAKEHNLPKKYAGKTVRKAADMLLRKNDVFTREGDTVQVNSIEQDMIGFMEAHEALTAMKEAEEEESFNEEMTAIAEKYPQQMQGAMPQEAAPQGMPMGMSPEEQMMMQQGAPQGMPMAKYGGNIHQTDPNMVTTSGNVPQYGQPNPLPNIETNPMMNQNLTVSKGNQRMQFGGNIHQYNPNMYNMLDASLNTPATYPDFADTDAGKYMQQSLSVPNTFDSSIPEYLQYDPSQGPMFEPTLPVDFSAPLPSEEIDVTGDISTEGKLDSKTNKTIEKAENNKDEQITKQKEQIAKLKKELNLDKSNVEKQEKLEYEQSRLSALTQMAPIAYNLGMGLFGKKDEITLSKLDPITLQRIDAEQQLKGLGYDLAGARKAFRNAAGTPGAYLGNMGSLFNRGSEARGNIYDRVNKANDAIANREAQMNLNVADKNAAAKDKETLYGKQAKQAKQNMFNAGLGQLANYTNTQDKNKLGTMYANAYADNPLFELDYNTAFSKEAREARKLARKNKKGN